MSKILKKKNEEQDMSRLTYLGFDGRNDLTLNDKNQFKREEHLTFVDKNEQYLDHVACSDKKGPTISLIAQNILEKFDSKSSIQIMATDGNPRTQDIKVGQFVGQN